MCILGVRAETQMNFGKPLTAKWLSHSRQNYRIFVHISFQVRRTGTAWKC